MDFPPEAQLGKADWIWDEELNCHLPCCTKETTKILVTNGAPVSRRCGNGPLTGIEIETGDCGNHGTN